MLIYRKILILISAVSLQACLGGIYAWSVFVPTLKTQYHLSTTQTQFVFGLCLLTFTSSMILAGRMMDRFGPRLLTAMGGVLFASGYYLASLSDGSYPILLAGIGVLAGCGIGCGYACPIVTCMSWFPNIKGLVTGLAVAGFGGGAVLLSNLGEYFLHHGMDVLEFFRLVAYAYGAIIVLSSLSFTLPPHVHSKSVDSEPPLVWYTSPVFWLLVTGMASGTAAGLLTIGNLTPIGLESGLSEGIAALAVSTLAVGNAVGRISWGYIYDRWGVPAISVSLYLLAFSILLLIPAQGIAWFYLPVTLLVGLCFGACFVLYAAAVDHFFGTAQVGRIYPLIFLSYGIAGLIGPPIGGIIFDLTGGYRMALVLSVIIPAAAGATIHRFLRDK